MASFTVIVIECEGLRSPEICQAFGNREVLDDLSGSAIRPTNRTSRLCEVHVVKVRK